MHQLQQEGRLIVRTEVTVSSSAAEKQQQQQRTKLRECQHCGGKENVYKAVLKIKTRKGRESFIYRFVVVEELARHLNFVPCVAQSVKTERQILTCVREFAKRAIKQVTLVVMTREEDERRREEATWTLNDSDDVLMREAIDDDDKWTAERERKGERERSMRPQHNRIHWQSIVTGWLGETQRLPLISSISPLHMVAILCEF